MSHHTCPVCGVSFTEATLSSHCDDCCCARSWKALGITQYTGKSIPEHITLMREALEKIGDCDCDMAVTGTGRCKPPYLCRTCIANESLLSQTEPYQP